LIGQNDLCLRWIDSVGRSGEERNWQRGEERRENKSTRVAERSLRSPSVADVSTRAKSSNFVVGDARDMVVLRVLSGIDMTYGGL
jgi:hypothetical protein